MKLAAVAARPALDYSIVIARPVLGGLDHDDPLVA